MGGLVLVLVVALTAIGLMNMWAFVFIVCLLVMVLCLFGMAGNW